jgi:excisionase family DNA binding protein
MYASLLIADTCNMLQLIKQAALELKISERFLRQLIAENRIPFYRLSARTLRVDVAELRDLMRLIAEGSGDE